MTDVCLVLEGSYPDVTGGVSAWVDRLMRGLPDVSFAVAHVGAEGDPAGAPVYAPPPNLERLVRVALDPERPAPDPGAADALPPARAYHALCTGAASALAARAAADGGRPFLLTEHGLAWHEAALGIVGCKPHRTPARPRPGELRARAGELAAMAREAYAQADAITSVCTINAQAQVAAGAPRERTHVIPNAAPEAETPIGRVARGGMAFPRLPGKGARLGDRTRPQPRPGLGRSSNPFRAGFVGRVVAVKDVATFLRAAAIVAAQRADCEFVVIGPLHHEPGYADACRRLAAELEIGAQVRFTGETDPAAWYPRLDALALTSVSEAQPLALLEAMAAGVPVLSSAVGGCPELVAGAGLLVPPRDPEAVARGLLALAADPALRARLAAAGRARAHGRHAPADVHAAYRALYERAAA
jgi:polysaccharide biosynthesis protein PelF